MSESIENHSSRKYAYSLPLNRWQETVTPVKQYSSPGGKFPGTLSTASKNQPSTSTPVTRSRILKRKNDSDDASHDFSMLGKSRQTSKSGKGNRLKQKSQNTPNPDRNRQPEKSRIDSFYPSSLQKGKILRGKSDARMNNKNSSDMENSIDISNKSHDDDNSNPSSPKRKRSLVTKSTKMNYKSTETTETPKISGTLSVREQLSSQLEPVEPTKKGTIPVTKQLRRRMPSSKNQRSSIPTESKRKSLSIEKGVEIQSRTTEAMKSLQMKPQKSKADVPQKRGIWVWRPDKHGTRLTTSSLIDLDIAMDCIETTIKKFSEENSSLNEFPNAVELLLERTKEDIHNLIQKRLIVEKPKQNIKKIQSDIKKKRAYLLEIREEVHRKELALAKQKKTKQNRESIVEDMKVIMQEIVALADNK